MRVRSSIATASTGTDVLGSHTLGVCVTRFPRTRDAHQTSANAPEFTVNARVGRVLSTNHHLLYPEPPSSAAATTHLLHTPPNTTSHTQCLDAERAAR